MRVLAAVGNGDGKRHEAHGMQDGEGGMLLDEERLFFRAVVVGLRGKVVDMLVGDVLVGEEKIGRAVVVAVGHGVENGNGAHENEGVMPLVREHDGTIVVVRMHGKGVVRRNDVVVLVDERVHEAVLVRVHEKHKAINDLPAKHVITEQRQPLRHDIGERFGRLGRLPMNGERQQGVRTKRRRVHERREIYYYMRKHVHERR